MLLVVLFVAWWSLFVVCCLLSVVLECVIRCVMFVVCCVCVVYVGCGLACVVSRWLCVV